MGGIDWIDQLMKFFCCGALEETSTSPVFRVKDRVMFIFVPLCWIFLILFMSRVLWIFPL